MGREETHLRVVEHQIKYLGVILLCARKEALFRHGNTPTSDSSGPDRPSACAKPKLLNLKIDFGTSWMMN